MNRRMQRMVPGLLVAVAVGASGTLLVTSAGGGATDAGRPHDETSTHESPAAACTYEDNGFAIGAEIARRRVELWTTGSTTVTAPPVCHP